MPPFWKMLAHPSTQHCQNKLVPTRIGEMSTFKLDQEAGNCKATCNNNNNNNLILFLLINYQVTGTL